MLKDNEAYNGTVLKDNEAYNGTVLKDNEAYNGIVLKDTKRSEMFAKFFLSLFLTDGNKLPNKANMIKKTRI